MKDVNTDYSADGSDNTSQKNKNRNRIVVHNLRQTKRSTDETWLEQLSSATEEFGSSNNIEYFLSGEAPSQFFEKNGQAA